ncbi:AAA family ATPase [Runella sp.]|uniref:AAA family ATPase n=1 Tax=Runella sp. TaxID=1960881 RepID=UPI003D117021
MQDASFRKMVQNINIQNFKSIKDLSFEARRVNVFIGEPNTGKSNILEALGLFSVEFSRNLQKIARCRNVGDLFHKYELDNDIQVHIDDARLILAYELLKIEIYFQNSATSLIDYHLSKEGKVGVSGDVGYANGIFKFPKYYKYKLLNNFESSSSTFLLPPFGENLPDVLFYNKHLRELVGEIISDKGYKLNVNRGKEEIDIVESEENGISLSYPFSSMSDTLQRIIFYLAAIESNKDSALIFEEPESHIFPFYNKYLAELIAQNEAGNQFFIATHNPYFLEPLIEKTPLSELAVYITYMGNYETKLKLLSEKDLSSLMGYSDIFLNLNKFLIE